MAAISPQSNKTSLSPFLLSEGACEAGKHEKIGARKVHQMMPRASNDALGRIDKCLLDARPASLSRLYGADSRFLPLFAVDFVRSRQKGGSGSCNRLLTAGSVFTHPVSHMGTLPVRRGAARPPVRDHTVTQTGGWWEARAVRSDWRGCVLTAAIGGDACCPQRLEGVRSRFGTDARGRYFGPWWAVGDAPVNEEDRTGSGILDAWWTGVYICRSIDRLGGVGQLQSTRRWNTMCCSSLHQPPMHRRRPVGTPINRSGTRTQERRNLPRRFFSAAAWPGPPRYHRCHAGGPITTRHRRGWWCPSEHLVEGRINNRSPVLNAAAAPLPQPTTRRGANGVVVPARATIAPSVARTQPAACAHRAPVGPNTCSVAATAATPRGALRRNPPPDATPAPCTHGAATCVTAVVHFNRRARRSRG